MINPENNTTTAAVAEHVRQLLQASPFAQYPRLDLSCLAPTVEHNRHLYPMEVENYLQLIDYIRILSSFRPPFKADDVPYYWHFGQLLGRLYNSVAAKALSGQEYPHSAFLASRHEALDAIFTELLFEGRYEEARIVKVALYQVDLTVADQMLEREYGDN